MFRTLFKHPTLSIVAGAILVGVLVPGGPAAAENAARRAARLGPLTVTAPRFIGREANGTPIERVSLTATVRVADLDLTTPRGASELNRRVRDVAASLCKSLEEDYPIGSPEYVTCIKETVRAASAQSSLIQASR